jgi:hypothetical protein
MRPFLPLAALAVLAGATLAGPAPAGTGEPEPGPRGARFELAASSPAARALGAGVLDQQLRNGGRGEVRVRVPGTRRQAVVLAVGRWDLDFVQSTVPGGSSSTLVLRVRVSSTRDPVRCPIGARGSVTLVDSDAGDSVRTSFARARCGPFARSWSAVGGDTVDVDVSLIDG